MFANYLEHQQIIASQIERWSYSYNYCYYPSQKIKLPAGNFFSKIGIPSSWNDSFLEIQRRADKENDQFKHIIFKKRRLNCLLPFSPKTF